MQALLNTIATMDLPTDARRIFHGRGGTHPGCEHWVLDFFAPVWVLTRFQPATEHELAAIHAALCERWAAIAGTLPLHWVHQCRHEGRSQTRLMAGSVPEPHVVTEDGARFLVHVQKGQNHGALAIGQQNHRLNALAAGASFLPHDIFSSWGKIQRGGPYDLVIVDPPSCQLGSFVAGKDCARLMRRLPDLLAPGGQALLCLNAPELGMAFLQHPMQAIAPGLVFARRLPNPPAFADVSSERSLKVPLYEAPAGIADGCAS